MQKPTFAILLEGRRSYGSGRPAAPSDKGQCVHLGRERESFHFPRSLDLFHLQRVCPVHDLHAGHPASGLFDMGGIEIGGQGSSLGPGLGPGIAADFNQEVTQRVLGKRVAPVRERVKDRGGPRGWPDDGGIGRRTRKRRTRKPDRKGRVVRETLGVDGRPLPFGIGPSRISNRIGAGPVAQHKIDDVRLTLQVQGKHPTRPQS